MSSAYCSEISQIIYFHILKNNLIDCLLNVVFIVFPFSLTYSFSLKYSTQVFPLVSLASASKYFLPLSMPYIMCYPNIFKIPITTPCHTHPFPSPYFSFREFQFSRTFSVYSNQFMEKLGFQYKTSLRFFNQKMKHKNLYNSDKNVYHTSSYQKHICIIQGWCSVALKDGL